MENCKPVDLPLVRSDSEASPMHREGIEPMGAEESTQFRRSVARLNYLALGRPDIAIAVNRLARNMAIPRVGDDLPLKRVLRYLKGTPRCLSEFRIQDVCTELMAYSDSDWAGCQVTRKSTSGTVLLLGSHVLSFSSRLQKPIALSSGEAELVAQIPWELGICF